MSVFLQSLVFFIIFFFSSLFISLYSSYSTFSVVLTFLCLPLVSPFLFFLHKHNSNQAEFTTFTYVLILFSLHLFIKIPFFQQNFLSFVAHSQTKPPSPPKKQTNKLSSPFELKKYKKIWQTKFFHYKTRQNKKLFARLKDECSKRNYSLLS